MKFKKTYRVAKGVPVQKFSREVQQYHKTLQDGLYTMTIEEAKSKKSLEQNAYFHGVLVDMLSKETGFTFRDCKKWIKKELGTKELYTDPISGKKEMEPKSIADYNLDEMSQLIQRTVDFLTHDLGLVVPNPEDQRQEF